MSDFMSLIVAFLILGVVLFCWWLPWIVRRNQPSDQPTDKSVGHNFDGIEELDNPVPKWWYYGYLATVVFSLGYLVLYPGLGNYPGLLGWTQVGQYEEERAQADEKYGVIFSAYAQQPVLQLAADEDAMAAGQRLFANNCAQCHGSAGRGFVGFPNLTDDNWQWGGSEQAIKHTLKHGRRGNMPARGINPNLTDPQLEDITHYLLQLNNREQDSDAAEQGQPLYVQACAACHGPQATGNTAMGAPDLTDDIWLYGGSFDAIMVSLLEGRQGHMPGQQKFLSEDQIHLLTAYVLRLSGRHENGE
ncbi:MAG: cytochrome-c oxidase, cbb3-type subunit III [Halomonadaceae bacterium]|nr:MAG: cytochrome-c oxidase, cbb3-type subunit III [Halomonadaceae bacterium]